MIEAIQTLKSQGHTNRRIAKILGVGRNTVNRYVKSFKNSDSEEDPNSAKVLNGSDSNGARVLNGNEVNQSNCLGYKEVIESKLEQGLSAQRVFQDLKEDHGYVGGYDSVQRFVKKLKHKEPKRFDRLECNPAEEMQVDFGEAYVIKTAKGKKKANILRLTLSYSRKSYSEAVPSQSLEHFIRAIENGLRHFGGAPQTVVLDNLRAGVKKPDWFDPMINPKFYSFCKHYGMAPIALRPRHPHHKGKVESSIKYVKNNGLKGRLFSNFADLNQYLRTWERNVADTRVHGTIKKQVGKLFDSIEKPALQDLPNSLYPTYRESIHKVHRDSYIQVKNAYYRVPAEYIHRHVIVRSSDKEVSIYNQQMTLKIRTYAPAKAGTFSDPLGAGGKHEKFNNDRYYMNKVISLGNYCHQWAINAKNQRENFSFRVLQGLHSLNNKYTKDQINEACFRSVLNAGYRLEDVKRELDTPSTQSFISFKDNDPIIRNPKEYQNILNNIAK